MTNRLSAILSILDEGFTIYRRHFGTFLLLTAGWFIPIILIIAGVTFIYNTLSFNQRILLFLGIIILILPLSMYIISILSTAADNAIRNGKILIKDVLRVRSGRIIGMSAFSIVYVCISQVIVGIILSLSICPLILVWSLFIAFIGNAVSGIGNAAEIIIGAIVIIFMFSMYAVILLVAGAGYISIIYALHPWVTEPLRFGEAFQHSFDLIAYRFRWNVVTWSLSALLLASAGISVALVLGVFIPLPILWLLDANSKIGQAIAITAWVSGFIVAIPPIPIWMALLYRRNQSIRLGSDLEQRVQNWSAKHTLEQTQM